MEDNIIRVKICPKCGAAYTGRPALSRVDSETMICPDCGAREAMESIGISPAEQEQILKSMHKAERKK